MRRFQIALDGLPRIALRNTRLGLLPRHPSPFKEVAKTADWLVNSVPQTTVDGKASAVSRFVMVPK